MEQLIVWTFTILYDLFLHYTILVVESFDLLEYLILPHNITKPSSDLDFTVFTIPISSRMLENWLEHS